MLSLFNQGVPGFAYCFDPVLSPWVLSEFKNNIKPWQSNYRNPWKNIWNFEVQPALPSGCQSLLMSSFRKHCMPSLTPPTSLCKETKSLFQSRCDLLSQCRNHSGVFHTQLQNLRQCVDRLLDWQQALNWTWGPQPAVLGAAPWYQTSSLARVH